ncbi:pyocin knob domain-containing protein [Alcaligenes faecalis]|uniref:pyocin knob domain-containing protein n=1 Tax=Alcaligenes faecalis TaxID=511 RepID=UPI00068E3A2C|nr:pyocin knob domain-containing protein [Alcaligenes faecalis]
MTTYKTGNPLGSVSPKDLLDNSENLDRAVNGAALGWKDRFDVDRLSWSGIEERARIDIGAAAAVATAQAREYVDEAQQARDDAVAAASASGEFVFAETYAEAVGTLPLPEGTVVEIGRDELQDEARTRYIVENGALHFAVNLDLLRIALGRPSGARLVGLPQSGTVEDAIQYLTPEMFPSLATAIVAASESGRALVLHSATTIRIPADCPDLHTALNKTTAVAETVPVTILIESGHAPSCGASIVGINRQNYQITSSDPVVIVDSSTMATDVFLHVQDCAGPVFSILLDMNGKGFRGIECVNGYVRVTDNHGVINCSGDGELSVGILASSTSSISAPRTRFTGSGRNIMLTTATRGDFTGVDASNAINIGAYISRGSVLHASNADFSNANQGTNSVGVYALRSWVSAPNGIKADNCRIGFYSTDGSEISASGSSAENCSFRGYYATGGTITCPSSKGSFDVTNGGIIRKDGSTGQSFKPENQTRSDGLIFDSAVTSKYLTTGAGVPVQTDNFNNLQSLGFYVNNTPSADGAPSAHLSWTLQHIPVTTTSATQLAMRTGSLQFAIRRQQAGAYSQWGFAWHTQNTTVDSNGFIKQASPIVKLFKDGIEKSDHEEIKDVEFERAGVGHYLLSNCPLLSRDGWYIETPKDRNGLPYFYLDYEENEESGTLVLKTYEPDYSDGPLRAAEPVDILNGRYISLRFMGEIEGDDNLSEEFLDSDQTTSSF